MRNKLKFVGAIYGLLLINTFDSNAQYCNSKAQFGEYEYISKVSLGTISNQSTSGLYQDFTTSLKATLYVGENYTLSITTEQYSTSDRMDVYVDWNADKVFTPDEKLPTVFTGIASKQGTVNYKMVIPTNAAKAETRMRIVLYDNASGYASYSTGCGNFEYGEVEDYAIEVKAIETAPEVDFFGDVTSVFLEGVVRFTDNSRLAPTQWKWTFTPATVLYQESTSESSQNPVVKFLEATNYSASLTATNTIGSATQAKAGYISVKNYSAPKNLEATTEGAHVNLTWNIPNVPAWQSYIKDVSECMSIVYADTDRGTLYDDNYLPFSFPVTITKLSSYFYQSDQLLWTNNQFKFRIYKYSDNTLLYESPVLTAQHLKEKEFELPTSITINEPFIVAIATIALDGTPSNIAKKVKPEECHTVLWNKETSKWEAFADADNGYEIYTRVYIGHDAAKVIKQKDYAPVKLPGYSGGIDRFVGPANVQGAVAANSVLSGYKIFRNDVEVGAVATGAQTNFVENGVADGNYTYAVKAVYSPTGISPYSNSVSVTVDNSNPEIQLSYLGSDISINGNFNVPSNVDVNGSREIVFTIKNEGRGSLTLGEVVLDNVMYSVAIQPTQILLGGAETTFTVKFTPTADGPQICKVSIATNDTNENPFVYNIKGIGGQDRWTWMLYLYEDGTGLDGDKDFNEWEVAGSVPGEVNYLVLYDCNDDSRDGVWYVKKDANGFNRTLVSEKLTSQIDPNMSSEETLRQYMLWVKDHYPAQHYGLTMWDHGDGIFKRNENPDKGVDKGFVGTMKPWQMSAAVKDFTTAVGKNVDIIGFDVCLLGQIETAYQFKDLANYVIASELTEPGDGWDYTNGFQMLSQNSATQADSLAMNICKTYKESYSTGGSSYATSSTQAVYSMDLLSNKLIPALNSFADSLIVHTPNFKGDIRSARDRAWVAPHAGGPSNPEHHDLGHFAKNIIATETLPTTLKASAQTMLTAYEETVIRHDYSGAECAAATGMKIWMPDGILDAGTATNYYTKPSKFLKFGETRWPEFLKVYQNPPSTSKPTAKFTVSATETTIGSPVYLMDNSLQSPNKWTWIVIPSDSVEFVNNTTSSSQNPVVMFKGAGYYSIGLTAQNSIGSDDTLSTLLVKVVQPAVEAPGNLIGSLSSKDVNLNWGSAVAFSDDSFDSYSPFSLNFGPWKQVDIDKDVTWAITGYAFPNSSYVGSFITFDGTKTTPAINGWSAPSGNQVIACFDGSTKPNNDWLISAKVTVKASDVLSFYGCSITDQYGLERMQVGISTTGRETTDFTMITPSPYAEVPAVWTMFQYDLSAYVGKDIYFCVRVISDNAWAVFFDNMHVGAPSTKSRDLSPFNISESAARQLKAWSGVQQAERAMAQTGTVVYRNGQKITDLTSAVTTYKDQNLANGWYTYYIQNVYADGLLKMYSSPSNTVQVGVGVTGIENNVVKGKLSIYPNPGKDQFKVNIPEGAENGTLKVYDLTGSLRYNQNFTEEGVQQLSLPQVANGVYVVIYEGGNHILVTKLVVN
ncbi:clostripain-related cysteine peptidase [Williamwhitmania taraxaci]|uniref:Por secretion system C-terminal sorting domain-containing protein n=1 Tax=Williamwhitmania taraxaci TaxID=1640674 RepID=A0A1G6PB08_9BACT|nr:clostripain-related cysteine peptidase [Williamwhitmania taraxaci]SDC77198.1 Por secretion system C-terminal sorting domain-containing protein [Williamwhitmania taraxaci]